MLKIKHLPLSDYESIYHQMKAFTEKRDETTPDELWVLEHKSVFTQGQAGKAEHILSQSNIPIVQSDRGGQVTYHGPGQVIIYFLIALKRYGLGIRSLVCLIEQSLIECLAQYDITATGDKNAPGVYVDGKKIASVGLRIKKGCAYHGLALNVDMDLSPFSLINPCGYQGLKMVQIKDYCAGVSCEKVKSTLSLIITKRLESALLRHQKERLING